MIIIRTPLRISLVGGGTDMPAFYQQAGFGAVVSFAINKYVYTLVSPKFDGNIRVSYSETENVATPYELKHDIIREALLMHDVAGLEVVTVADIPGKGTGLGSSSSLAVGMIHALRRHLLIHDPHQTDEDDEVLAMQGYMLESDLCKHTVGKQDHYAAACGDLHYFRFNSSGSVDIQWLRLTDHERKELASRCVLLWTGKTRQAADILTRQSAGFADIENLRAGMNMRDLADSLATDFTNHHFGLIGEYLNFGWQMKKTLAHGITDSWLDAIYRAGMEAGALGGKLCGAGGGGFFLFYASPEKAQDIVEATGLERVPFEIDTKGSTVIYEA